ncbi:helix-turn-helix domain-containing protein [bacterium SCSIO 12741]|nr:helix-turn-helix domain-containing protein [bacterium SCSIO 12741]
MRSKDFEQLPIRSFAGKDRKGEVELFSIEKLMAPQVDGKAHIEAHRHDYYHIMYIKNGIGAHTIDFKQYEIKPQSLFFVSPSQVHSLTVSTDVDGYVVTFTPEFYALDSTLQRLLDYPFFHSMNNEPVVYLSHDFAPLQQLVNDMLTEYNAAQKGANTVLRALLEVFLVRIARVYSSKEREDQPSHLSFQLRKLESLIDIHFKEIKKLNDYAELMHISPKHLNTLCKTGLNKTVTNLIHERTLLEAKRLLLFTDNSVTEIAFDLGFSDKSYFMRFFKKQVGITAESYRMQEDLP